MQFKENKRQRSNTMFESSIRFSSEIDLPRVLLLEYSNAEVSKTAPKHKTTAVINMAINIEPDVEPSVKKKSFKSFSKFVLFLII